MIQLSGINISFGDKTLFKDLGWNIGLNERIALVGPNGAGKTTLFKVALGLMVPTAGQRSCSKSMRTGYLPQEEVVMSGRTVLDEALSVFSDQHSIQAEIDELSDLMSTMSQNDPELPAVVERYGELHQAFEGFDGYLLETRARSVLQGLGFTLADLGQPVENFSGGWQMRIALAKLLLEEPSYLFLDEPTNHLDIESMDFLEGYLKSFRGTMVVISHDRYFIDRTIKKIYELELGRLSLYHTNYSGYLEEKEKRRELLIKQKEEQDKEIEHLKEFVARWRGNFIKRAMVHSREKMLERLQSERIEIPQSRRSFRLGLPEAPNCGRRMLELSGVSKSYGDKSVLENIDFLVEKGHKIGLLGVNGAGKTTLLKMMAGVEEVTSGQKTLYPNVSIAYFAQHTAEMLDPAKTVMEQVESVIPTETPGRVRTILGSFLFSGDDVFKKVKVLSGGEKARLALCCTLLLPANLLIMDEPTNHLDLKGKEVLEQALKEFNGTVVLVTHDRYIIDQVVDVIIEVADRGIKVCPGNYSDYIYKKELDSRPSEMTAAPIKAGPESEVKTDWQEAKRRKAQEAAEERRRLKTIAELEHRIEKLEKRQKELESETGGLADPEVYRNGEKMKELMNEFDSNKQELQRLYDRWELHHREGD
jgi:ATP-binding cassette subfamily F protein 3